MKLLNWLQGSGLSISWKYEANGVIWRLLVSEDSFFVGEDRDIEKKTVSFFCLDGKNGLPLWKNHSFDNDWWISIEVIHRNVVFIHKYATPDLPDHKQIMAFDLQTGKQLWSNEDAQFCFVNRNSVYISKTGFEQRRFFELNLNDGTIVREVPDSELDSVRQEASAYFAQPLVFPDIVSEDTLPNLQRLLKEIRPYAGQAELTEYIQYNDFVVSSYHIPMHKFNDTPRYVQHLVVSGLKGRVFFEDILSSDSKGVVPDGFFMTGDMVCYIKDRKELCALQLRVDSKV